ncbi:MAG: hypothetical protein ACYDBX_00330 [Patescibacteria group bacterium]
MKLMTKKSIIFFIVLIVYLAIITYIFLLHFPAIRNSIQFSSSYPFKDSTLISFEKYLNPSSSNINKTNIVKNSSYEVLNFSINDSFSSFENIVLPYYMGRGFKYYIFKNKINFTKGPYLITYKGSVNNISGSLFVPQKVSSDYKNFESLFTPISFKSGGSYPFTQSEMQNVLSSLNTSSVSTITETGFTYYTANLSNVAKFQYNKPIEMITGKAILWTQNQTQITNLLHSYMNEFTNWGYFPFTVYGAIIDNNTIYYLKYGLGAATVEIQIKPQSQYSVVLYTAEVTASASDNFLLQFQHSGWKSVFN